MKSIRLIALSAALCAWVAAPGAFGASTRTHVSAAGNDANTAFSCDYAHPCRTFAAALTVTTPGGEILAVDSGGFGRLVIDRSVSIVAAPGVFAGIGVGAGGNATGVAIATAGVDVVLRGLTIIGQGGDYGILVSGSASAASLTVENCVLSGFGISSSGGLASFAGATVRVVNSDFRDNYFGLLIQGAGTADVSASRFSGNYVGIAFYSFSAGITANGVVSDTILNDGTIGVLAYSGAATGVAQAIVERSSISNHNTAVVSQSAGGGSTTLALSGSLIAGNGTGLYQSVTDGGSAILNTLQNNTVAGNATNTLGTITAISQI